jgi:uncharacterized protein YceH (UPF0502 family)
MLDFDLNGAALRVLGCLIEKERTTPEYYPLSLNALASACNQKTNRDPVLALDEAEVARGLEQLRSAGLAMQSAEGSRVARYAHNVAAKLQLDAAEVALLAELLLRGPQTAGELRARAERMHHFADIADVESSLGRLIERDPPLVAKLARQPGRKEPRYQQLLGGAPSGDEARAAEPAPESATEDDRVARLEAEVRALRAEVNALWKELRSLTMQPEPE